MSRAPWRRAGVGQPGGLTLAHVSALSILYLALPNLLFVIGWLRWQVAVPCVAILIVPTLVVARDFLGSGDGTPATPPLSRAQIFVIVAVTLALLLTSGVGGAGYQETDWLKHNALLKDLIARPWPVRYDDAGASVPLVYYVAYLLPAAAVGKIAGWHAANLALFAWTCAGMVLVLAWTTLLIRPRSLAPLLVFLAFSGLDILGTFLFDPASWQAADGGQLEWWAVQWQYSANLTLLSWVPHQALAAWIATALVVAPAPERGHSSLFVLALLPLWSPFAALGVALYLIADALAEWRSAGAIAALFSGTNFCGLILLVLFAIFFSARLSIATPHGWSIFEPREPAAWWIVLSLLPLFCLLEFGCYGLALAGTDVVRGGREQRLFLVSLGTLCALPFYRYGYNNDLAMRASIPALLVLCVLVGRALLDPATPLRRRMVLGLLVAIGSSTPIIAQGRHVAAMVRRGEMIQLPPMAEVRDLWHLCEERYPGTNMIRNYVGSSDATFFRLLAKDDR
jgi:hypothetical protein